MSIPMIELPASAFGALGITLDGADEGGSNGQAARVVPVIAPRMADERQWCATVNAFVHHGVTGDFAACPAYRAGGTCARAGGTTPCAFLEGPEHPVWAQARGWYHLPGVGLVHAGLWAAYGITVETQP